MYSVYRWIIRLLYAVLRLLPVKNRIAFLSRQGNRPSLDFRLLESALRQQLPNWQFASSCYRDSGSFGSRIIGTLQQLRLVAGSRLCIVDSYTPAVSIPKLAPETVVIQLWHALGTFKCFGWQSVGTSAGRTEAQARGLCMHRNYRAVIACGEGARTAYSQAFGCAEQSILPLGMPRIDYLLDDSPQCRRKAAAARILELYPALASGKTNILYAPTFRKGDSRFALNQHVRQLADCLTESGYQMMIALHPFVLRQLDDVPQNTIYIPHVSGIDLLELADYVITDYSAIAFEAALLRCKLLFYVPDIEEYRLSPGLCLDPEQTFPSLSFRDSQDLLKYLEDENHSNSYERSGFWEYCLDYLTCPAKGATERLARHLAKMME